MENSTFTAAAIAGATLFSILLLLTAVFNMDMPTHDYQQPQAAPAPFVSTTIVEATVRIRSLSCGEDMAIDTGSGFAIDDHTILTAAHVVEASPQVQVDSWDGQRLAVTKILLAKDGTDLAWITVKPKLETVLPLAIQAPEPDEGIFVNGYPDGGKQTMLDGNVLRIEPVDFQETPRDMIVTDVGVISGNSGGPVVNRSGQAVGIVHGSKKQSSYMEMSDRAIEERKNTTPNPSCEDRT